MRRIPRRAVDSHGHNSARCRAALVIGARNKRHQGACRASVGCELTLCHSRGHLRLDLSAIPHIPLWIDLHRYAVHFLTGLLCINGGYHFLRANHACRGLNPGVTAPPFVSKTNYEGCGSTMLNDVLEISASGDQVVLTRIRLRGKRSPGEEARLHSAILAAGRMIAIAGRCHSSVGKEIL